MIIATNVRQYCIRVYNVIYTYTNGCVARTMAREKESAPPDYESSAGSRARSLADLADRSGPPPECCPPLDCPGVLPSPELCRRAVLPRTVPDSCP